MHSELLQVWLRSHWGCKLRKGLKIRIITNRTRERDGGETAGEALIAWLRTTREVAEWRKIKCLLFCGDRARVRHVCVPGLTFASSRATALYEFCEKSPDWAKVC